MNYSELSSIIDKITLSKEEEKEENIPQFIELYGDLESEETDIKEPYYLKKYKEVYEDLKEIRKQFSSNKEFYISVSKSFAQKYIPLIIKEYDIKEEELLKKLNAIYLGEGIKIFDKGEAQSFAQSLGETINGDVGAYKFHDMICFTPDNENEGEVSVDDSIKNATKMLASMIHETLHLIIDVTKEEHFINGDESKLTSGGTVLNEGIIEMLALDFSKKYNLIHLPALYYLNNVKMCRILKQFHGEEFNNLIFNDKYEKIIPGELLEQYKNAERTRYFARNNIRR